MCDLMQYALIFYDFQLILAQMGESHQGCPGATASGRAAEMWGGWIQTGLQTLRGMRQPSTARTLPPRLRAMVWV